jgi:hypothetical protein
MVAQPSSNHAGRGGVVPRASGCQDDCDVAERGDAIDQRPILVLSIVTMLMKALSVF